MLMTAQIKALFPRAGSAHMREFCARHSALFVEFGVSKNSHRVLFFLAQIGHESRGLSVLYENLTYTAPRLVAVWPRRFSTVSVAAPYVRNPVALGNHVYANRNGNGDEASGDGHRYRGRGYMQLTGRGGYRAVGALIGQNLEEAPELASHPELALRVALGYWKWRDVNALCDTGDFKAVTKIVNGGLNGWEDRLVWLAKVKRCLELDDI
jgi:putative chitinase